MDEKIYQVALWFDMSFRFIFEKFEFSKYIEKYIMLYIFLLGNFFLISDEDITNLCNLLCNSYGLIDNNDHQILLDQISSEILSLMDIYEESFLIDNKESIFTNPIFCVSKKFNELTFATSNENNDIILSKIIASFVNSFKPIYKNIMEG